jgi:hypothetical protein
MTENNPVAFADERTESRLSVFLSVPKPSIGQEQIHAYHLTICIHARHAHRR